MIAYRNSVAAIRDSSHLQVVDEWTRSIYGPNGEIDISELDQAFKMQLILIDLLEVLAPSPVPPNKRLTNWLRSFGG